MGNGPRAVCQSTSRKTQLTNPGNGKHVFSQPALTRSSVEDQSKQPSRHTPAVTESWWRIVRTSRKIGAGCTPQHASHYLNTALVGSPSKCFSLTQLTFPYAHARSTGAAKPLPLDGQFGGANNRVFRYIITDSTT